MEKFPHLPACKCGMWTKELMPYNEWYIAAPQYNNCFWTYMRHNPRPHGLKEVADLLGLSISAVTSIERKAMEKFKKKLKKYGLQLKDQ